MWITLSESQVLTRISGAELNAFRSAAKAAGQGDPLPEIISQVIRYIRGRVAACDKNTLAPGETIPDELQSVALDLIVWNLMKRPAAAIIDRGDARKNAAEAAERILGDVARCTMAITQPETTTSEVVGGGSAAALLRPGSLTAGLGRLGTT